MTMTLPAEETVQCNSARASGTLEVTIERDPHGIVEVSVDDGARRVATGRLGVSVAGHPAPIHVEVSPSHRGRGIATAVLSALMDEARNNDIAGLCWRARADDVAVRKLADAAPGAICARRVQGGVAKGVLLLT